MTPARSSTGEDSAALELFWLKHYQGQLWDLLLQRVLLVTKS